MVRALTLPDLSGPVLDVAPALLGARLSAGGVVVRLTEVEAYAGEADPGSHAFRGPTPRTQVMFGPAGRAYVYFTYGMHWCTNIVTGPDGEASAVLLRAGEVVEGLDVARARRPGVRERDLCRGPARLCRTLGISGEHGGVDLLDPRSPVRLVPGPPVEPVRVRTGPRVGVAGDGAATPWRFWVDGEVTVSPYRPAVARGRRARSSPTAPVRDDRRVTGPATPSMPPAPPEPPTPPHPAFDALPTIAPVDDVLADLEWRGLVAQTTDREALARDLADGPITLYCGFDPTAESLHVGSLVPLLALRRFQLAGHRPIALAGGATGFIGDPTGRTSERTMMTPEVVAERTRLLGRQMRRFLDFAGPAAAVLVDNYEWTAPMGVLEFLRDVGAHFPVNAMLARESVSARLESGGLSFTEFSYQLLQSMDYVELYRRHGCRLQIGGNDQWGNITAGLDLLRRVERGSGHALTFPLVTDATGQKIGKSTGGGNVWLAAGLTSPYALYQFALNVDDRDAGTYLRLLTFVGQAEVEALDAATRQRPQARAAQRRLAVELVGLVHGGDEVRRVQAASEALFGGGVLEELDEQTLAAALAQAPSTSAGAHVPPLVDLLAAALGLSKSDARRAVREGGAYLNNRRVTDESAVPGNGDWLHGRFLVLRRGKRAVAVVERTSEP